MNRTLLFGTRTIFIRAVPKIWCSVNGPYIYQKIYSHDLHTQLAEATHILSHPSNIYRNPSIYSGFAYRLTKKPFTSPLNSHTSCSTINSLTCHISSNPHLHNYTSLRVQAVSEILYKHMTGLFKFIYHLDTPS